MHKDAPSDDNNTDKIVGSLAPSHRLLVPWVWKLAEYRCFEEPGAEIYKINQLINYVALLQGEWTYLIKEHPEVSQLKVAQNVIDDFYQDLSHFREHLSYYDARLKASDKRYRDCLGSQDRIDIERLATGNPILIPNSFNSKNMKYLGHHLEGKGKYREVTPDIFAKEYGKSYRIIYCANSISDTTRYIDDDRIGNNLPLLYTIDSCNDHPYLALKGNSVVSEACGHREFTFRGVTYRRVSRARFTKEYALPFRVINFPVKSCIAYRFYNILRPICNELYRKNDPMSLMVEQINACYLDKQTTVFLEHPPLLPSSLHALIEYTSRISNELSSDFAAWIAEQREDWVRAYESHNRATFPDIPKLPFLPDEIFYKIFTFIRSHELPTSRNDSLTESGDASDTQFICSPLKDQQQPGIPLKHQSLPMNMKDAARAIGGNMNTDKLKRIIEKHPEYRQCLEGQSFIFDVRYPPFDKLKGFDPKKAK